MRKYFVIILVVASGFTACKKIIDAIFNGVDVKAPEIRIEIPAIPFVCPGECPGISNSTKFNLDSSIRANTGGVFGAKDVRSIKIKEVQLTIPQANASNNLGNFQSARVVLYSDVVSTPVEIVNFTFDDVFAATKTLPVENSVELLPYLKGSELFYTMYGKLRRPTSIPLTFVTLVTLRVD